MRHESGSRPSGSLTMRLIRADDMPDDIGGIAWSEWPAGLGFADVVEHAAPQHGLSADVNAWRLRNARNVWRGARRVFAAKALQVPTVYGALFVDVIRANGDRVPFGLASLRVVTDAGAGQIAQTFQAATNRCVTQNFHGIGTGGTAEAASQTALVTESTAVTPASTRATGTQTNPTAMVYRTVATVTATSAIAVTEHAIFNQAATGGGTMLDRSLFSVINLASSDSIAFTYDLTIVSGG